MKRAVYILLIVVFLVFSAAIFLLKPAVIFLTKKNLSSLFTASAVSIRDCQLKPFRSLTFSDLEIKRGRSYDFKIGEIKIEYNLPRLLTGKIDRFALRDAEISINLPDKSIAKFNQYLNLSPRKAFLIQSAQLAKLNLKIAAADFNMQARVSADVDLIKQTVNYCDLKLGSLNSRGLYLEEAILEFSRLAGPGSLAIKKIKYDKAQILKFKGSAVFASAALYLDSLSGEFLDGSLTGNSAIKLDKNAQALLNLKFTDLNLATLISDFNLKEKAQLSGTLEGSLSFNSSGADINTLQGNFSTTGTGGRLTIRDTKFLENVARNTGESLDILIESFKDYHYNRGRMELFMDRGNLIFNVALEGEAGRRDLNIVVHDFKLLIEREVAK